MLEIEQRYCGVDFPLLEQRLREWGAQLQDVQDQADHYYNAPDRDLRRSDEVFRLRRVGGQAWLTYKGPRRAGGVKTRRELEVPLAEGEEAARDALELLRCLGYRAVAVVCKRRHVYPLRRDGFDLLVCLDELAGVGRFVELEILGSEAELEQARAVITRTATELGLTEVERRSYLTMVLEHQRRGAGAPEGTP
jgi:adenylate cyclase class 2